MDLDVIQKLQKSETVKQMLEVLIDEYRLEDSRPGPILKGFLMVGLKEAIKKCNPKRR